jgi:hypothetical protein
MAAAEGRLSAEELDERLDAAFRARTYGELGALLADLPMYGGPAHGGPMHGGLVARGPVSPAPWWGAVKTAVILAVLLPIVLPLTVVALLTAVFVGHGFIVGFFPVWLLWLAVFLVMRHRRRSFYGGPGGGRGVRGGGARGIGAAGRRGGPGFWV